MTLQSAIEQRAALLKQAKAYEDLRAAVLEQVAVLEREYKIGKSAPRRDVVLTQEDSFSGIMNEEEQK